MREGVPKGNRHVIAAAKALGIATLATPLLSWPTYFAVSNTSLSGRGPFSEEGIATLIMLLYASTIVTFVGILCVALPLTALGHWISRAELRW